MPKDEMLKRARRQRETVRSTASTDVAELQASMQAVTGANRVNAQKMLARLRRYQSELADFDRTILDNVTDADYDTEVAAVYKHRNTLTGAIAELDSKVSDCQMPRTSAQMPVLEERIPEMELTEFDGNPLNFEEFWDDFSTSVDKRTDISTITKFKLLRRCLVGKAAATCKNYGLTTANYEQVKSILEERYGDKETAIAMHLDALIRMKPAASDAVSELIRLRDDCELHVRALVILGFGDDAFGQLFAPIILSKLPANVRLEIRKQKKLHGDIKWTMKRLRELLSTEIGLRASNEHEFLGSHSSDCAETDKPETSKASDSSLFVTSSGPAISRRGEPSLVHSAMPITTARTATSTSTWLHGNPRWVIGASYVYDVATGKRIVVPIESHVSTAGSVTTTVVCAYGNSAAHRSFNKNLSSSSS